MFVLGRDSLAKIEVSLGHTQRVLMTEEKDTTVSCFFDLFFFFFSSFFFLSFSFLFLFSLLDSS